MASGWGEEGWSVPGFGGITSVSVNVSGVSGSAELGVEAVRNVNFIVTTGLSASGLIGEEIGATNRSWGIGDWGQTQLGWGGASLNVSVPVTGVEAFGLLGDEEPPRADANVNVTGVHGDLAIGVVTFQNQQNLNVLGFELTLTLGDIASSADANLTLTGLEATGEEGTVAEVTGGTNVVPIGVTATSTAGDVNTTGIANVSVTGVAGIGVLGEETARATAVVIKTGVQANTATGTVAVKINQSPVVTGVSAIGTVDSPLVWGGINTSQTPNWVEIDTNAA